MCPKVSDQLDSPKSPRNQELYEYYLNNRNVAAEKDDDYDEDEEMFLKVNQSNYSNIESLKLKFASPPKSSLDGYKPLVSNWLSAARHLHNGAFAHTGSVEVDGRKSLDTSDSDANDSASYQAKKQAFYRQQQQDKPVFKYLSKNLMNNLFARSDANASVDSLPRAKQQAQKSVYDGQSEQSDRAG